MIAVTVGIVTYNSLADLPHCLAGLALQKGVDLQIVIWDNASSDGCADWMRDQAPEVTLLESDQNRGFGYGHNQILATVDWQTQAYYLPLNPDVFLLPDYIATLAQAIQEQKAGWGIGKLWLPSYPSGKLYSVGHALRRDGYAFNIGYGLPDNRQPSRWVFGASGAALLYSAAMIRDLMVDGALFDPAFFLYYEDVDVDWRAQLAGWQCWHCADAHAYHRGSEPSAEQRRMALENRFLSVIKNAFWRDLLLYNLPLMALHILARLLLSPRQGWALLRGVLRNAPHMLRQRITPAISRQQMRVWFRWADQQATAQPRTWLARWQDFRRR